MSDIQVLGLTRFSYPSAPGAFGQAGLDELRASLYDDARLELRFFWLEQVALPSLRAQTDADFRLVILIGDQLPKPHRDRLTALTADIPQVRIVAMEEGLKHSLACREAMTAARDPLARAVAEFRLDDDDAIAVSFVEETRKRFDLLAPLFDASGRVSIDFCRGLLLRTVGPDVMLRPVMARLWTPGLVTYRKPGDGVSLLDANHLDLWKLMPVLSLRYPTMFVRGAHSDNASAVSNRWDQVSVKAPDLRKARSALSRDFKVDLAGFKERWQVLHRSC